MPTDPKIDTYIAAAAPFAQPILRHLRSLCHRAEPDIAEAIKWGRPFFLLDGRPLAMMAAFKAHAAFGFWGNNGPAQAEGAGDYGKLVSLDDLPDEADFNAAIAAATARLRSGAPIRAARPPRPEAEVPADLAVALDASSPDTRARWAAFAPSHRRDYVEWITEAKRAETRARRLADTIERIARGETRNAKYEPKIA